MEVLLTTFLDENVESNHSHNVRFLCSISRIKMFLTPKTLIMAVFQGWVQLDGLK